MLPCLLQRAQKPRRHALAAEERRSSTPMDSVAAVKNICHLPRRFRESGISAYKLVCETGINPDSLDVHSVSSVLSSEPELIDDWLGWSEDQRCSPAYYFIKEESRYVVGLYPGSERVEFSDRIAACADFIVKHLRGYAERDAL